MTHSFKRVAVSAALVALGLAATGAAQAQSKGSIFVRGGVTQIAPNVSSGDLSAPSFAGTKADVKADTQPTFGVTYMLTDNVALDLPIAFGFKHDIGGDGAIAHVGKIGEVKALPITLLAQYRLGEASAPLRPYVGAGPTYAKFYKPRSTAALTALTGGSPSTPTTLSMESKLTVSLQAGLVYNINAKWSVDACMVYTPLKTRTTLSTGQTLDAKLDPSTYSVALQYKF